MLRKKGKNLISSSSTGKGLDVGTAFIYAAQKKDSEVLFRAQRNAFFDMEYNEFARNIFDKSNVKYIQGENKLFVIGDESIKFANMFGRETRRPMKDGIISPEETEALPMVELIIKSVLGTPSRSGEICYYSIPGSPVDANFNAVYHQNIIKGFLEKSGYDPKPVNEGLAVVFSELAENNFTGMGISFGGGMVNVCLASMSVPIFSFSMTKAGDWIDSEAAKATNIPVSRVTAFKETSLNLKKPEDQMTRIEQALSIYYNHLIIYILDEIKKEIIRASNIPEFEKPIPVVISGGTVNPPGFIERFKELFKKIDFPLKVEEIKLASYPLYTVAKGTLIAAIAESKKEE